MIRPDQIPDAVVEAARRAYEADYGTELSAFTAAIAAALNAWPGSCATFGADDYPRKLEPHDALILPLPQQEGSDE